MNQTIISIGASRDRLAKIAALLATGAESKNVDVTIYGKDNNRTDTEVVLQFSNSDMEDRAELAPDAVLIDIEQS